MIKLHRGDAFAWLDTIPEGSVDLIVTDPPYESLEKWRAIGTTTRLKRSKSSSNQWFSTIPNACFGELFGHFFRILRPDRHLYLFCDATTMWAAKPAGEAAGFTFVKPLVWDKVKIGMGYHYRACYEFILFFTKGNRKLSDLGVADILRAPRIQGGYPTEKPVDIMCTLVRQSSQDGEVVVDPFMGSGSVGVAAARYGRSFLGCDVSSEAFALSRKRIKRETA